MNASLFLDWQFFWILFESISDNQSQISLNFTLYQELRTASPLLYAACVDGRAAI